MHDTKGPETLLIVYSRDPKLVGRRYDLDPSATVITVGRHAENTITIDSDSASRRHARFEKRADGWWVVDNNSTNGTDVNFEPVSAALLRRRDKIKIGDTIFMLDCALCQQVIDDHQYSPTLLDRLTNLYNRRYLLEQLDRELRRTERYGRPLALVMFDIDHFKKINDSHGHLAGDQVLRDVASLMRQHARADDVLARYGGEEFALVLPETDLTGAAALAETIRADVAAHVITFEERTIALTVSAGVAQADDSTRYADDLIRSADQRLYQAKLGGRNRVLQ